jgi:hypothetical protein
MSCQRRLLNRHRLRNPRSLPLCFRLAHLVGRALACIDFVQGAASVPSHRRQVERNSQVAPPSPSSRRIDVLRARLCGPACLLLLTFAYVFLLIAAAHKHLIPNDIA